MFYEEFLGLPLLSAFEIDEGRALHTFFQMADGSCLAFFEAPGKPFEFKRQDTLDLHIALAVDNDVFEAMLGKAQAEVGRLNQIHAAYLRRSRRTVSVLMNFIGNYALTYARPGENLMPAPTTVEKG